MSEQLLRVGMTLDGYCGGVFELGPDQVRVEAIGADWVVVRQVGWDERPQLFVGPPEELLLYAQERR
ncbi:hypothetical protein [Mycolicibacterium sphagni]|uniref:Uncharacterized protein n=1 Tax=Mycolicibacterium sphagni TaxID=1786 RepID=A0A255DTY0_9MYCO|nr:hypothetical protein [Mycolicibacterium sphagni]OYN80442.1 hypothetical protein CG716_09990 [Mycolicibacterium sphagni]